MAKQIEDYGIIGNTRSAALVSADGDIDWLCIPRFDSDACFAALLGAEEHGAWSIRPAAAVRARRRRYRPETLVLESEVECDGGKVRLIDFMPPEPERHQVVRLVEGIEGQVPMEMRLSARFGFGAQHPWVQQGEHEVLLTAGTDALRLRSFADLHVADRRVTTAFTTEPGRMVPFVLSWYPSHTGGLLARFSGSHAEAEMMIEVALDQTEGFWRKWASRCVYHGPWRDLVLRSLITLKALTYSPTGGIIAAPTTSLPEDVGGVRNWDYRFCWLRDASLTLEALITGGYVDEAGAWRDWLLRSIAGEPAQIQIMYGLGGERRLVELALDWLPGYEGSRPVRIGNDASRQFQLDVYGEFLSAIYLARHHGLPSAGPAAWLAGRAIIEHVANVWNEPDDGIWETRGGRRHFTYSKVMAWVAIDRAIRYVEEFLGRDKDALALAQRLRPLREQIHRDVCDKGFDARRGAFTQSYGDPALDASVLLIPHVGFLPATDPRFLSTVRAIERELVRDGLVRRYETERAKDGLPGDEGAFLPCSFWLADAYAMSGRVAEAEALFARLASLANDLGLLAEEYDTRRRRQVGNFPQAFSHVALVNSAVTLAASRPASRPAQDAHAA